MHEAREHSGASGSSSSSSTHRPLPSLDAAPTRSLLVPFPPTPPAPEPELIQAAFTALDAFSNSGFKASLDDLTTAVRNLVHVSGTQFSTNKHRQSRPIMEKNIVESLGRLAVSSFVLLLPESSSEDDFARVSANCSRLEQALAAYVEHLQAQAEETPSTVRTLRGSFSSQSRGKQSSSSTLDTESVNGTRQLLDESIEGLGISLEAYGVGSLLATQRVTQEGELLVSRLSRYLKHLSSGQNSMVIETCVQALFDDCSLLFLGIQSVLPWAPDDGPRKNHPACTMMSTALSLLHVNLERLHVRIDGPNTPNPVRSSTRMSRAVLESVQWEEDAELETVRVPQQGRKVDKLSRLLGDKPPWIVLESLQLDARPWYLKTNLDSSTILFDLVNGAIKGGTVEGLVECLTRHDHRDSTFRKSFLLTFKSFTTVDILFGLLVARFNIVPPAGLTESELADWKAKKQVIVQLGVLIVFKDMVSAQSILLPEDYHIIEKIKDFISLDHVAHFNAAKTLKSRIERLQKTGTLQLANIQVPRSAPPPPIMPKSLSKLQLINIDPLESARQLTILENKLYQKITANDLLRRARGQKTDGLDSITVVIDTSNKVAEWVQTAVLRWEDNRERASTIKNLISVAYQCLTMHNFTSMAAIVSGLHSPPVRRLKRTWDRIRPKYLTQLQSCEWMMSPDKHFNNERTTLLNTEPPCIPFIGRFLSDLQFIQDGNKDLLPGGLINFRKQQMVCEVIQDLLRWQPHPHNFTPLPEVQAYLYEGLHGDSTAESTAGGNADKFWNTSLALEPRETTDEAVTRILQGIGM